MTLSFGIILLSNATVVFHTASLNAMHFNSNKLKLIGLDYFKKMFIPRSLSIFNYFKTKKETSSTLIPMIKNKKNKLRTPELLRSATQSGTRGRQSPVVSSTKELDEAGVAVGLVLLLLEAAFAQGLQAEVTHQVVGVELGPHGGDAAAQDRLLAGLTHAAPGLVVVGLAQRLTLVLEEAAVDERRVALLRNRGREPVKL